MRGEFYTERDIVDLVRRGERQLRMREGDRMTDLARERARKDGVEILGPYEVPEQAAREASSTRYAVRGQGSAPPVKPDAAGGRTPVKREQIREKVQRSVKARLGEGVDEALINRVIERVMDQVGLD